MEKISAKSAYSEKTEMKASSAIKKAIWVFEEKWISKSRLELVRKAILTIKVPLFESKAAATKSFFPTSSTCLVVEKVLAIIYNLYLRFRLVKLISILLKMTNDISRVIFILMLANRKVFSKNQNFLSISYTKKAITISKASSLLPLIFWALILIF